MYLKILKCSRSDFWYNDHVGETFKIIRLKFGEFRLVIASDGYSNIVRIEDCELVE